MLDELGGTDEDDSLLEDELLLDATLDELGSVLDELWAIELLLLDATLEDDGIKLLLRFPDGLE